MTVHWRNRIVGTGEEAPDQLVANPANWRTHPGPQREALRGSLSTVAIKRWEDFTGRKSERING